MADDIDRQSKTEPPSPRRREQAAEEGQFAHSSELNSGIVLFAGACGLLWLAQTLGGGHFNNAGTLIKSDTGTTKVSVFITFINTGTIDVQNGDLDFAHVPGNHLSMVLSDVAATAAHLDGWVEGASTGR